MHERHQGAVESPEPRSPSPTTKDGKLIMTPDEYQEMLEIERLLSAPARQERQARQGLRS